MNTEIEMEMYRILADEIQEEIDAEVLALMTPEHVGIWLK